MDPETKHATCDSPTHRIISKAFATMSNESRCDSRHKLIRRSTRYVEDVGYAPKRISDMQIIKIRNKDVDYMCLECSSDIPTSMKDYCCSFNIATSIDRKFHCCK